MCTYLPCRSALRTARQRGTWLVGGLILGLTISPTSIGAQERALRFDRITVEDGLSNDSPWAIHQDAQGFLWLGTAEGLNRYDGYSFRVYRHDPEDPDSLSSSSIQTIISDSRGDLWIGTLDGGLNQYQRQSETFARYQHVPDDPTSLPHNHVASLLEDHRGDLWVGTEGGLTRLRQTPATWSAEAPAGTVADLLRGQMVSVLHQHRSRSIWAGTGQGLVRLDPESGAVTEIRHNPDNPSSLTGGQVSAIEEDSQGRLWIATTQGLNRLDPGDGTITHPALDPAAPRSLIENDIYALQLDRQGELWIGTFGGGLVRFDPASGRFSRILHDPTDPRSLANDLVISLFEDRTGVLWTGSLPGLSRYDPARESFAVYRPLPDRESTLSDDEVWALTEDRSGDLWVGTAGDGLDRFDRARRTVVNYRSDPQDSDGLQPGPVTTLHEDRSGTLWIGTWGGLSRFDRSTGRSRFIHYPPDPEDPSRLSNDEIQSIYDDSSGRLWIGTLAGLHRFDREAQRFVRYPERPGDPEELAEEAYYAIHEDRSGAIWFGTDGSGLFCLTADSPTDDPDPGSEQGRFHNYRNDPDDSASLSGNIVLSLLVDRSGDLWVGTGGAGLNRLERGSPGQLRRQLTRYWRKDGLPSDTILGILEDREGRLWLSTGNGLSRFDPESTTFKNYDANNGLSGNSFAAACDFHSQSGEMFFGGSGGVTAFFPRQVTTDPAAPAVAITDFLLFNTSVPLVRVDPDSPLTRPIPETQGLTLSHRDYVFAFEFAALHFASPRQNRYAYRLEGFDPDWVSTDATKRFAQYSNIAPGDYVFRVKAANRDGVWNDDGASIRVRVLAAPWKTRWAYTLYGLALAGALLFFVRSQKRKVERERSINQRLMELDRMKDQFLANTSHELRTPLYGMTGLAESLLDGARGALPPTVRSDLTMLVASGRRLSGLVNDILDVARLQRSGLELDRRPVDLRVLVDVVLALSRPLVGSKDLVLRNAIPEDMPAADADENRLEQILHNLVGNAIKFTESGKVVISAHQQDHRLTVSVTDTGIGIPTDQLERIFEIFEQVDASEKRAFGGTGLGLAITRELVELHGSALTVESTPGQGSTFSFSLPVTVADAVPSPTSRQATTPATTESPALTGAPMFGESPAFDDGGPERESTPASPGDSRRILVVDDEPVIRQVLVNQLTASGYLVTPAGGGPEALRLIAEQAPDLVLLDVMMPGMSGYEVCDSLRAQHPLEKLPIIFLTAKNQVADLVSGFAARANDYLTKPISKPELLARVDAHLELLSAHRRLDRLVTERTAQSEERQQLIQELKVRNSELARFTYTVSHDLKSPLVTIKGFLGLLARDAETGQIERMHHDIRRIKAAADHMQQLLEDLLALSRAGRRLNPMEDIAIGGLVCEALDQVTGMISERGVEVEVAPDLPVVRADRMRLLEILQNLLENAAKYMGDQPSPRVEVGVRSEGPVPVIYVSDNGVGIEPRYHHRVFGLFERLDASGEGTGVGLALVQRIVEVHGGEVWVESEGNGRGSTFCFTLERPGTEAAAQGSG